MDTSDRDTAEGLLALLACIAAIGVSVVIDAIPAEVGWGLVAGGGVGVVLCLIWLLSDSFRAWDPPYYRLKGLSRRWRVRWWPPTWPLERVSKEGGEGKPPDADPRHEPTDPKTFVKVCFIDFGPDNLDRGHRPGFRLTAWIFNGTRSTITVESQTPSGWVGYMAAESTEKLYGDRSYMVGDGPFKPGEVRVVHVDVQVPRQVADDMLAKLETEERFSLELGSLDIVYRIGRRHHHFVLPGSVRVTRPLTCRENQVVSLSPATVEVDL